MRELGYTGPASTDPDIALETEHERPADHSVTQFLTDHFLNWLHTTHPTDGHPVDGHPADGHPADAGPEEREPWFAHLSFIRPHPPYDAAGHYALMYDPADCPPALPIPQPLHRAHEVLLHVPWITSPTDPAEIAHMRSQYYGMITEVDHHVGRVIDAIKARGEWDDTVVIITSDHGEQLGDHGLIQKCGHFEASYHILCIVRVPGPEGDSARGRVVQQFTENVDIAPTICEAIGVPVPLQCDGLPLTSFLHAETPRTWRTEAHYEWDWRDALISYDSPDNHEWPWHRGLERSNLAVVRSATHAYVQYGDGDWLCYDLEADPGWQVTTTDPAVVLPLAQRMLVWRQQNRDRTLTGMLMRDGGVGRRPEPVAGVSFTA